MLWLVACGPATPPHAECPPASGEPGGPWARTYGGSLADTATSVAVARSGELLVAGSTESFGAEDADVWVLKLGLDGGILWEQRFVGPLIESAEFISSTRDGGSLVVAEWAGKDGLFNAILLAKLDCAGGVEWARVLDDDQGVFASQVQQTPDDGFLLVGAVAEGGGFDCLAVKLSRDGNVEWQSAYGRRDWHEGCHSAAVAARGGYLVAGEYERSDSSTGWEDIWLLRLDSIGRVEWEKTYGDNSASERLPIVREIGDGSFLVSGWSSSLHGDEAWLLSIDADGRRVRQRRYGAGRTPLVVPVDMWVAPDGATMLAGWTRPSFGSELEDVWVLRLNPPGEPVWSKRYGRETLDRGSGIVGLPGERFAVVGTMAWGSLADDALVLLLGGDGTVGSLGNDLPVATARLDVIPEDTEVPTVVPGLVAFDVTLTVRSTRATVQSQVP